LQLLNVHQQCSLQASVDYEPSSETQETLEMKEQLTIDGRLSSSVSIMLVASNPLLLSTLENGLEISVHIRQAMIVARLLYASCTSTDTVQGLLVVKIQRPHIRARLLPDSHMSDKWLLLLMNQSDSLQEEDS
jgi:hypothetical protein